MLTITFHIRIMKAALDPGIFYLLAEPGEAEGDAMFFVESGG